MGLINAWKGFWTSGDGFSNKAITKKRASDIFEDRAFLSEGTIVPIPPKKPRQLKDLFRVLICPVLNIKSKTLLITRPPFGYLSSWAYKYHKTKILKNGHLNGYPKKALLFHSQILVLKSG